MKNELKTMKSQFTEEQLSATPKEILKVLFQYLGNEINSNNREVLFLETTLTRTRDEILPEMQKTLENMLDNKKPKTQIKNQRKLINKCINNYNQSIDEYNKLKIYLSLLKNDKLMIAKILGVGLQENT